VLNPGLVNPGLNGLRLGERCFICDMRALWALTPYSGNRGLSGLDDCLWQSLILFCVQDDRGEGTAITNY